MSWADLFASASTRDGVRFVLDRALSALAARRNPFLHATVVAATPSARELCHLLDLYRVPVPQGDDQPVHGGDASVAAERVDQLEVRASSAS